jgi:NRPS condensation-like uncharacterized protein
MPPARSITAEMVEVVVHALEHHHPHVHLHLLVDLERSLELDELRRALAGLVAAFPVLGCRYVPGWWRDRWVPWEGDLASLCHREVVEDVEPACYAWAQRPMRYLEEPTVRLAFFAHGAEGGGGGRLVLSLHHMVADGGGVKAAGAVLAALLCGVDPQPAPSDDRALWRVARSLRPGDLPILAGEMLRESVSPLWMLRVRRLDYAEPTGPGGPDPHWRPVRLDRAAGARLLEACRERGATINDALVAAVARMAARRSEAGPVMVAYTVDLRRYLREKRAQVTNLAGVNMVLLERGAAGSAAAALGAVNAAIGEQKRRLIGLGYALAPAFTIGWLPHGLLRWAGAFVIRQILRRFDRAIAVTNIGSLDEALAPFGDHAVAASITGPFIHGIRVPVITATGFRGELTLQVVATATHSREDLETFATELEATVGEAVMLASSRLVTKQ